MSPLYRSKPRELDVNDRLFLQNVHNYMRDANIRTLKDDPEGGYQLVITYRKLP